MSILSFPDRGPWGSAAWRGNCSGHVYRELFEQLRPAVFVDPMVGSGTSVEVAREMGIEAHGLDLHAGFDVLADSILAAVGKPADLVVSHPPYGSMIVYSGEVWGEAPHPADLSRCVDDEDFCEKMTAALLNQRDATAAGGVYGTIIGDLRRDGRYVSYQAELIARLPAAELSAVIIKAQHNTRSDARRYGRMRFPRITHEYVLLWSRPRQIVSALATLTAMAQQAQRRVRAAWKAVVRNALAQLGGAADLRSLYAKVAEHAPEHVAANPHWQAKVRQVLQLHPEFAHRARGQWELALAA